MTKLPEQPLNSEDALPAAGVHRDGKPPSRAYRYYVLATLTLVYTLNFLDRQILGILGTPIKEELKLTNSEFGLMGGLAFAILYSTMALPIAWLADRSSRRRIMAWALGLWSGFTAICGFAHSFLYLFLARVGVGVGEAGGVAPAYSMVSDYFPKHQRARALAIYSLGIPIGSGAGVLVGGLIAANYGWRWSFFIVGTFGVVLAPIFRATIKDPPRGGYDNDGAAAPKAIAPRFLDVLSVVTRKPSFWLMAFGAGCSSVCGYGVAFWLPTFFRTSLGLSLVDTSWYYGAISFVGGCLGVVGGGMLADRMGARSKAAYPRIPAVAFIIALPCFFFAVNTSSLVAAFPLFLIPTALNLMWLGPILTAVQHLVPSHMRTTASAMFLTINNLLGIAVGLYYFGAVTDALQPHYGADAMRYAFYSGLGFYAIAAIVFLIAAKTLEQDWVES